MEELIKGYLGHGVMGLVAGTMLVLYIRKDRECSRLHALMFGKMMEIGDAWKGMVKELSASRHSAHKTHDEPAPLQIVGDNASEEGEEDAS